MDVTIVHRELSMISDIINEVSLSLFFFLVGDGRCVTWGDF